MKKVFLFLGICLFAASAINAQTNQPAPSTPVVADNPNAPEITFDKVVHDYGTIIQGGDATCEFAFKNTGNEPLVLQNVQSSCGCTVPEWPREPFMKGKSGVIKVRYDSNRIGPINKVVTVTSNGKTSSVRLTIKGTVVPKSESSPMPEKEQAGAPATK